MFSQAALKCNSSVFSLDLSALFLFLVTVGTRQESASHQGQEGEDINRALNLEEVVQESSNEWTNIF